MLDNGIQTRLLAISSFSQIPESADIYEDVDVAIRQEGDPFHADTEVFSAVLPFLNTYDPSHHDGKKLLCKVLVRSANTYSLLQTGNSFKEIEKKVELYPYTQEDMWAHLLFATFRDKHFPSLDRESISFGSDKTVHLVIIGYSSWAESLAKMAAMVCHFPNYIRDISLRTRITLVDIDIKHKTAAFRNRMRTLFDNSYVRYVDTANRAVELHRPMYYGSRRDFVDVEWEFVDGDESCMDVNAKLSLWAKDQRQLLTVALCSDSEERNMSALRMLPAALMENGVPVLAKIENSTVFSMMNSDENVKAFGSRRDYEVLDRTRRMAMAINYVYDRCYSLNIKEASREVLSPAEIDFNVAAAMWQKLSPAKKFSNIYNALCLSTKMRSLGHKEDDWGTFYSISAKEIDQIAVVEHNRWCVEELMLGFRPVDEKEQKEIEDDIKLKKEYKDKGVHYDLRAYDDLRPDETGKPVTIYDVCLTQAIPLIATTCKAEEGVL